MAITQTLGTSIHPMTIFTPYRVAMMHRQRATPPVLGFGACDRKTTTRFTTTLRCSTSRGPCAMALGTRLMVAYRVGI